MKHRINTPRNQFAKEIFRSVTHSMSRFLAICAIVALGAGFYAGLRSTAPNMRITVDHYADKYNTMDIQGVSTMGFTKNDIKAVRELPDIKAVMPGYSADAVSKIGGYDNVLRFHSLPDNVETDNSEYINRVNIKDGRLPEKEGECLIGDGRFSKHNIKIGSTLTLEDEDGKLSDSLKRKEFTIVGTVETPYYLSFDLGNSDIGNGIVDSFVYVREDEFAQPFYTNLFATVKGADKLMSFGDEYTQLMEKVTKEIEKLSETRTVESLQEIKDEAMVEVNDAQKEYDTAKADADKKLAEAAQKLADGKQKITDSEGTIASAEQEITDGENALASGTQTYNDAVREFDRQTANASAQIASGQAQIDAAWATLEQKRDELSKGESELWAQTNSIEQAKAGLAQLNTALVGLNQGLEGATQAGDAAMIAQYTAQIEGVKAQIAEISAGIDKYNAALSQISAAQQALSDGENEIRAQQEKLNSMAQAGTDELNAAGAQLISVSNDIDANRQKLNTARAELESGKSELETAKVDLQKGQSEYDAEKAKADKKLADGQADINDAKAKIDDIEQGEWFALDRESGNIGLASFTGDAERMDSLSSVFPILFFLVAALVSLTTMTRMVDEERVLIGTYKALGYSKSKIMSKYIIYATLATLSGSIIGIVIFSKILPIICWNSYRIMYIGPNLETPINIKFAIIGCLASALCTLAATVFACRSSLHECPANLMLPRAPKAGKRILLERIPFLWKHLGFTQKVTARNLLRYKRRFIMTVVGIAGCTALLLTGFGIKDSVSSILSKQYDDVYNYNVEIAVKNGEYNDKTRAVLEREGGFDGYEDISMVRQEITVGDKTEYVFLETPKNTDTFKNFVNLRSRRGKHEVKFDENSVVLTEKLAQTMSLKVGDSFTTKSPSDEDVSFTVTGITEHYIYHYIYIAPEIYESTMGEKPEYNKILAQWGGDLSKDGQQAVTNELLEERNISTVTFLNGIDSSFRNVIKSLNYVVLMLIVCAGALAFVVLYNLTNINVTERQREIATIKVLGFYDKEVSAYVYRETSILTIIGCGVGLLLGIIMQKFVIKTVEVDMMMFGREIEPLSFVFSAILTLFFAVIVNLVMFKKLKKISMVESLKSVD